MKKPLALLATTPLVLLLAACGASTDGGGSKPRVIASFYPLAYVSGQVGGSFVEVSNLTSPGVEPHDLELKPRQVGAVQEADLVVYEQDFQPAVDAAVAEADLSEENTVDVTDLVRLLPSPEDAGVDDPHVWLDPKNMIAVTEAVEEKLSTVDPGHAAEFAANGKRLIAELESLDADFESGLTSCRTRTIVTSHDAFQYLATRYDLTEVPISGIDPTNEPSASQLAEITQLVRTQNITTIFTEELVSPAIARTIADETGASTATLDPIEGLSDDTGDDSYLTLMRTNLDNLRKANSCS